MIRDELTKSLKAKLFNGLSGAEPNFLTAATNATEGLTAKMLRDFVKDLETDKRLGTCAACAEPVWRSQYNGYLVYMDKLYHVGCLGRKLWAELT